MWCGIFQRWLPFPSDRRSSLPSAHGCMVRRIHTVHALSPTFWKDTHRNCQDTTVHAIPLCVCFLCELTRARPWFGPLLVVLCGVEVVILLVPWNDPHKPRCVRALAPSPCIRILGSFGCGSGVVAIPFGRWNHRTMVESLGSFTHHHVLCHDVTSGKTSSTHHGCVTHQRSRLLPSLFPSQMMRACAPRFLGGRK